jgi:predicted nucleic acid-binding protein
MSDFVVDSCVVVKWFISEPDSSKADRLLREAQQRSVQVVLLDLAFVETANVFWKKRVQALISDAELHQHMQSLQAMPLRVEPARPLLGVALNLAVKHRLPVYDCLFVALSDQLGIDGITSDDRLYHAVHASHPNILLLRTC